MISEIEEYARDNNVPIMMKDGITYYVTILKIIMLRQY